MSSETSKHLRPLYSTSLNLKLIKEWAFQTGLIPDTNGDQKLMSPREWDDYHYKHYPQLQEETNNASYSDNFLDSFRLPTSSEILKKLPNEKSGNAREDVHKTLSPKVELPNTKMSHTNTERDTEKVIGSDGFSAEEDSDSSESQFGEYSFSQKFGNNRASISSDSDNNNNMKHYDDVNYAIDEKYSDDELFNDAEKNGVIGTVVYSDYSNSSESDSEYINSAAVEVNSEDEYVSEAKEGNSDDDSGREAVEVFSDNDSGREAVVEFSEDDYGGEAVEEFSEDDFGRKAVEEFSEDDSGREAVEEFSEDDSGRKAVEEFSDDDSGREAVEEFSEDDSGSELDYKKLHCIQNSRVKGAAPKRVTFGNVQISNEEDQPLSKEDSYNEGVTHTKGAIGTNDKEKLANKNKSYSNNKPRKSISSLYFSRVGQSQQKQNTTKYGENLQPESPPPDYPQNQSENWQPNEKIKSKLSIYNLGGKQQSENHQEKQPSMPTYYNHTDSSSNPSQNIARPPLKKQEAVPSYYQEKKIPPQKQHNRFEVTPYFPENQNGMSDHDQPNETKIEPYQQNQSEISSPVPKKKSIIQSSFQSSFNANPKPWSSAKNIHRSVKPELFKKSETKKTRF